MSDIPITLPAGLRHMDDDEKALANLPLLVDRMKYHTKRLRVINYASGAEGVTQYKAKFPEARPIQLISNSIAFQPKPKGYDDFLCDLVRGWFVNDTALSETNRAAVERLNRKLGNRFDPDRHFSVPLSPRRLGKLADIFAQHGARLDTSNAPSMSKVRSAVKAAKARRTGDRPLGNLGHISGKELTVGGQTFAIQRNGNRECIRPTINGSKRRLYLDELQWLSDLWADAPDLSSYEIGYGNGTKCRTPPHTVGKTDPLADAPILGNGTKPATPAIEEWDYLPDNPPTLGERLSALKAKLSPETSATQDPDADPLAL